MMASRGVAVPLLLLLSLASAAPSLAVTSPLLPAPAAATGATLQLVVCTMDGHVYSLDPATGRVRWATELPASDTLFSSSVTQAALPPPQQQQEGECAGDAEECEAGARSMMPDARLLPAIDGSGRLFVLTHSAGQSAPPSLHRLPVTVPEIVLNAPFTGPDGLLYLGSRQSTIFSIDAASGSVRRVYTQGMAEGPLPLRGSDTEFLLGRADYVVHAVDSQSSMELWNVTVGEYVSLLGGVPPPKGDSPAGGSGKGGTVFSRASDNTLAVPGRWRIALDAPVVSAYLLTSDMRLHKVPISFEPPADSKDAPPGTALVTKDGNRGALVVAQQGGSQGSSVFVGRHNGNMYAVTPDEKPEKPQQVVQPETEQQQPTRQPEAPRQPSGMQAVMAGLTGVIQTAVGVLVGLGIASLGWFTRKAAPATAAPAALATAAAPASTPPAGVVPVAAAEPSPAAVPQQLELPKAESAPVKGEPSPKPVDSRAESPPVRQKTPEVKAVEAGPARLAQTIEQIPANEPSQQQAAADLGSPSAESDVIEPVDDWEQLDLESAAQLAKRHIESERRKKRRGILPQALPKLDRSFAAVVGGKPPADSPSKKRVKVGRLELTGNVLGHGSAGTVVYEGMLDGRRVAIKRLLKEFYNIAQREVNLLIESDEHPNLVRYYAKEEDEDFVYIALTFCERSLNSFVEERDTFGVNDEVKLIMHDILSGISHIHSLNIVHRDIKPQNILLDSKNRARISDMGLAKKFEGTQFSFSILNAGSAGWMAPELLEPAINGSKSGMTCAVDVFAVGCLFYYIATKQHPYGERIERDANIAAGRRKLTAVVHIEELHHLIVCMTEQNPPERLSASDALKHPFFWTPHQKLQFLLAASDRLEVEKPNAPIVLNFEAECGSGVRKWDRRLDRELLGDLTHHRKYNFDSARDLLRVMRNKANHYYDLPEPVRRSLGPLPEGFLMYFMVRYPGLLMQTYSFIKKQCTGEPMFEQFFNPGAKIM